MDLEEKLSPDEKATLAEIDRVLRASLDIEPSQEFLARVRRRINDERARPRSARVSWRLVAATLGAVAATIVAVLMRPAHVTPTRTQAAESRPAVAPRAGMAQHEAAVAMATPALDTSLSQVRRARRRRERDVLVDPRSGVALAEYAAAMRTQKGAIAGSLDARVAAVNELPRYQGVPLESTAATEDLCGVSVLEELPRFERSDS
jgi:hypothetical protein